MYRVLYVTIQQHIKAPTSNHESRVVTQTLCNNSDYIVASPLSDVFGNRILCTYIMKYKYVLLITIQNCILFGNSRQNKIKTQQNRARMD